MFDKEEIPDEVKIQEWRPNSARHHTGRGRWIYANLLAQDENHDTITVQVAKPVRDVFWDGKDWEIRCIIGRFNQDFAGAIYRDALHESPRRALTLLTEIVEGKRTVKDIPNGPGNWHTDNYCRIAPEDALRLIRGE